MEEELFIALSLEDAKKACYLLNCGILRINGDAKKDEFDKESVALAKDLMEQLFAEYRRVKPSKKGRK